MAFSLPYYNMVLLHSILTFQRGNEERDQPMPVGIGVGHPFGITLKSCHSLQGSTCRGNPTRVTLFSTDHGAYVLPTGNGWWIPLDRCLNPMPFTCAVHLGRQCLNHRGIWPLGELISSHLCPEHCSTEERYSRRPVFLKDLSLCTGNAHAFCPHPLIFVS